MISLNTKQEKAQNNLTEFISGSTEEGSKNNNCNKFLLLGMAGSGKTTVIVSTFNKTKLYVAFCAFTNKATQVLCKISQKFNINFSAQFMTIHQLLALEIKYNTSETDIDFNFKIKKAVANMVMYDVIIFDECSTISNKLYEHITEVQDYIKNTTGKIIKYIFVGDYWQLPPVNENNAIVFKLSICDKWPLSKLDTIMRSNNDTIRDTNLRMLEWIPKFKAKSVDGFIEEYPFNLVSNIESYLDTWTMLYHYIDTWHNKTPDCVILTCSRKNCEKINNDVQYILNNMRDDVSVDTTSVNSLNGTLTNFPVYSIGDRICLVRPVILYTIICNNDIHTLSTQLPISLYNGEIFDVINVVPIKIKTDLNKFEFIADHFDAYKLTIKKINKLVEPLEYNIVYIPEQTIEDARCKLKSKLFWRKFLDVMTEFIKKYPKIEYGYCLTIYKSQGSEWDTVYVNLNNIKWCIAGAADTSEELSLSKKISLFKNTYTAVSRASNDIYCIW
jgi:GTPase SAR1 family protein